MYRCIDAIIILLSIISIILFILSAVFLNSMLLFSGFFIAFLIPCLWGIEALYYAHSETAALYKYRDPGEIRTRYEHKLKTYFKKNTPKTYLINKYCEARIITENGIISYLYVKERPQSVGQNYFWGHYLEVKNNIDHVSTMWAIFDMEFNSSTKYSHLEYLYTSLNNNSILYHTISLGTPPPIHDNNSDIIKVQNEFCRMEINTLSNGEKIILCSEIWGTPDYDKPKKFVIKAELNVLHSIMYDFTEQKRKLENYSELLEQYSSRSDCQVITLEDLQQNKREETMPVEVQNMQQANLPVETSEQNSDETKEINFPPNDSQYDSLHLPLPQKFDERNLDL